MVVVETLTVIEFTDAILSMFFALISIYVGIRLMKIYLKQKKFEYYTLGVTWIVLTVSWWPGFINYFSVLFFDQVINVHVNVFLQNALVPLALICWTYSFTILNYGEEGNKKLVIPYIIIGILYEIVFLTILFYDPYLIVYNLDVNGYNVGRHLPFMIFPIFAVVTAIITGYIFARKSMKIDDKKIQWRGKLILLAFVFFFIGAILDTGIAADISYLIFKRILITISGVFYYLAFFMPEWLSKRLIK